MSVALSPAGWQLLHALPTRNVVRLPEVVDEPAYFLRTDPGTVFDLRDTRFLGTEAVRGLVVLAKREAVCVILAAGPVQRKLAQLFHDRLTPRLDGEWEISLCPRSLP